MKTTHYQKEFEKIISRDYFVSKVNPIREIAFKQFITNGIPSKTWKDLRFTNLTAFNKSNFRISESSDAPKNQFNSLNKTIDIKHKIIFYNGHYQKNLSSLPNGIKLLSNNEYYEYKKWKVAQPKHSPFDLLNTAFMDSGMCLIVEKNVEVNYPIILIFISSGNNHIMTSPRLHIDLNESSSLSLVEHHIGKSVSHFSNTSSILYLKENSHLNHIRIQMDSSETINIGNIHVQQEKNSNYNFSHFAIGSILGRIGIYTDLDGAGSESHLNGLTLSDGDRHLDTNILTNHNAPNCISTQNFRTVLKDKSSGVFNGRVVVSKDAQKTDSNQSNKNLLLSHNAKMNSNPQLVINANNVKCSHGSSTGELDPDALFYMRSRGLDEKTAKSLLVNGFASEVFDKINNKNTKKFIINEFNSWLDNENKL